MIKIKVDDATVEQQQVNGRNGSFLSSRQYGWLEMSNGERRRVRLPVSQSKGPLAVGEYTVADSSFTVDSYGSLGLARLELEPVPAVKPAQLAGASR